MISGFSVIARGSADPLSMTADYSVFRVQGDTANSFVEIHYTLKRNQLKFVPSADGYVSIINFKLLLKNPQGEILDSTSWKAANKIKSLNELNDAGYYISDKLADILPIGNYKIMLMAENGEQSSHVEFNMDVPPFIVGRPTLSSIELAYRITPDTASGKFNKNGLKVMPNPSGLYSQENKMLAVYAEGYGLDTTSMADSIFTVTFNILSEDGNLLESHEPVVYHKPGESAVIATQVPIDSLRGGDYRLRIILADGSDTVISDKNFSIVVSREAAKNTILEGLFRSFSEANNLKSDEDAAKFRNEIIYIATPDELKLFDSLNLTGKASFQKDFWARRDPDPSTPLNEFEIEHYKRYEYVQDTYGQFKGGKAGWKTDRGRVYMIYGEPSEIERFPPTIGARAWERWWYHGIEGGVYFIFVDFENADDYTLIHSTAKNEIKDQNWDKKINMAGQPSYSDPDSPDNSLPR
jgi:GWxTD domain-containing protein